MSTFNLLVVSVVTIVQILFQGETDTKKTFVNKTMVVRSAEVKYMYTNTSQMRQALESKNIKKFDGLPGSTRPVDKYEHEMISVLCTDQNKFVGGAVNCVDCLNCTAQRRYINHQYTGCQLWSWTMVTNATTVESNYDTLTTFYACFDSRENQHGPTFDQLHDINVFVETIDHKVNSYEDLQIISSDENDNIAEILKNEKKYTKMLSVKDNVLKTVNAVCIDIETMFWSNSKPVSVQEKPISGQENTTTEWNQKKQRQRNGSSKIQLVCDLFEMFKLGFCCFLIPLLQLAFNCIMVSYSVQKAVFRPINTILFFQAIEQKQRSVFTWIYVFVPYLNNHKATFEFLVNVLFDCFIHLIFSGYGAHSFVDSILQNLGLLNCIPSFLKTWIPNETIGVYFILPIFIFLKTRFENVMLFKHCYGNFKGSLVHTRGINITEPDGPLACEIAKRQYLNQITYWRCIRIMFYDLNPMCNYPRKIQSTFNFLIGGVADRYYPDESYENQLIDCIMNRIILPIDIHMYWTEEENQSLLDFKANPDFSTNRDIFWLMLSNIELNERLYGDGQKFKWVRNFRWMINQEDNVVDNVPKAYMFCLLLSCPQLI